MFTNAGQGLTGSVQAGGLLDVRISQSPVASGYTGSLQDRRQSLSSHLVAIGQFS